MMKIIKHFINAILIIVFLSSGFPLFPSEDANKSNPIGLADAILSVRDFANSADNPDTFSSNIRETLTALNIAAGLKTVIKPYRGEKSLNTPLSPKLSYLASSCAFSISPRFTSQITEYTNFYRSIKSTPVSPPPRLT